MSQRLEYIDGMRGVAATAVMLCHVATLPDTQSPLVGLLQYGALGVPVFFAISGFIICHTLRGEWVTARFAGRYAVRRSLRLDPPYWAVLATMLALYAAAGTHRHSWQTILANMTYLHGVLGYPRIVMGSWSLCLEVQFYVALLAVIALTQRLRVALWIPIAALGAASLCIPWSRAHLWQDAYHLLPAAFPMFAIGILAALAVSGRAPRAVFWLFVAAMALRLAVAWQIELAGALVAGIGIYRWFHAGPRWLISRPVLWLGAISYSLYLIHPVAIQCVCFVARRLVGTDGGLAVSAASIALSLVAAVVLYRCVERPSHALAKRLGRGGVRVESGHASAVVALGR